MKITMTTSEFDRTDSGKSWRSKPHTVETKQIDLEQFDRITSDDTQKWFRRLGGSETATRSYTFRGYVVTRLVSTSPDREIKKVREFEFSRD